MTLACRVTFARINNIGAFPKDVDQIVSIFDTAGGGSEELAQFTAETVDTWKFEKRPDQQRHQELSDINVVATPLAAHATSKQTSKIEFLNARGNLVIGQSMNLRKCGGNWSVRSSNVLFTLLAAWFIVCCLHCRSGGKRSFSGGSCTPQTPAKPGLKP